MAEPTFTMGVGNGRTLELMDAVNSAGEDVLTVWGYQNFITLMDKAGNDAHIIFGTGAPSADATYDLAPLASLYLNYGGGDGTCAYFHEAVSASGWAAVTTDTAA
jgi:hypothetical protein